MNCPKCEFEYRDGELECLRCGIVFAKYKPRDRAYKSNNLIQDIAKEGRISLLIGFLLAVVALASPAVSFILHPLLTIIHELGHTVIGWLFGYPSLPAFDFVYGGGVTLHGERKVVILLLIYLLFLGLFFYYIKNRSTAILLTVGIILYTLFAFTSLHQILILFMGHGSELILSGVFIYRALSGSAITYLVERPLYAFTGFFLGLFNLRLSYQLSSSEYHRFMYEEEKGGGHWMDFSRIAEEHLNVDLSTVSIFFFLCCFLPPILGFLAYRHQRLFNRLIANLLRREY